MTDDWPLKSYLELGALPSAVSCARLHARHVTWEWGYGAFADTIELLVSELITNACKASRSVQPDLPVRMWLLSDKARVLVQVWDGSPGSPTLRLVDADAESGRGLLLVEALSDKWEWCAHQSLGGKVVWCELAVEPCEAIQPRLTGAAR